MAFFALPIPLLLSREVELEAESLLDGFSMILEFDKLSFLVKLEMVRSLDWTEGTWWLPVKKVKKKHGYIHVQFIKLH